MCINSILIATRAWKNIRGELMTFEFCDPISKKNVHLVLHRNEVSLYQLRRSPTLFQPSHSTTPTGNNSGHDTKQPLPCLLLSFL
jgi:hypothetical protein